MEDLFATYEKMDLGFRGGTMLLKYDKRCHQYLVSLLVADHSYSNVLYRHSLCRLGWEDVRGHH
nr:hypothetical protein HAGR004_14900 [Bdellovibrio sp. HAGR004]